MHKAPTFAGSGHLGEVMVDSLMVTPQFFGEAYSWTWTHDLSLLVEGTSHHTKALGSNMSYTSLLLLLLLFFWGGGGDVRAVKVLDSFFSSKSWLYRQFIFFHVSFVVEKLNCMVDF